MYVRTAKPYLQLCQLNAGDLTGFVVKVHLHCSMICIYSVEPADIEDLMCFMG
jgi:hypothetical protein